MAYICDKSLEYCTTQCPHYRYDEDEQCACCLAEYDKKHETIDDYIDSDPKALKEYFYGEEK